MLIIILVKKIKKIKNIYKKNNIIIKNLKYLRKFFV